jgi:hypothetical protein
MSALATRVPRQPITFVYGNLVWGPFSDEVWAVYGLEMQSYEGRPRRGKLDLMGDLADAADGLEADFQLLRITRQWSLEDYVAGADATVDARHGHPAEWRAQLDAQRARLEGRAVARPEVYLAVRLSHSARTVEARVAAIVRAQRRDVWRELKRSFGVSDPRGLRDSQLADVLADERDAYHRLADYVACERASTATLQWLVARSLCRGLGEPEVDDNFQPQAIVLDDEVERRFVPLEHDVLRLFEPRITVMPRDGRWPKCLRVQSELGDSWQAFLTFGALADTTVFPGPSAELLFAPLEAVDFPVDAVFSARHITNEKAVGMVRHGLVHADNIFDEESHGDHGPSAEADKRPQLARELEARLTGPDRTGMLRASVALAVGAPTREELERRVARLRREYGTAPKLLRPKDLQLKLFVSHLPGQLFGVPYYDSMLLPEEFGAMVPTATTHVGTRAGPAIARTLSAAELPVLFDLTEACRSARPPSVLCAGTPGSGKTMLLQYLMLLAALQGSVVCDIDPKGDHRWTDLPEIAGHVEVIELSGDPRWQGLLDPLRIGDEHTREDLATTFLVDLLPIPFPATWRTEIRRAVQAVVGRPQVRQPTCLDVVAELLAGDEDARAAGRAIETYARGGLARLGFASAERMPPSIASKQITSIRIRQLPRPLPGTPKSELSEDERIGQAVLRLMIALAMRILSTDRSRHKVVGFEEAWFLLQEPAGQRLIEHLNRWGRSEYATPILVTHLLAEAEQIDNLIGARFIFGQESEAEAIKGLGLLRLDRDDDRLVQRLLSYRKGLAMLRDYEGRVAPIRIDPGPRLLEDLDTTPGGGTGELAA